MSEYIKKDDILSAAVEVEYLGRQRMMVSVAKIGQLPAIEINDSEAEHTCENCYYENFHPVTYPCSLCVNGIEREDLFKPKIAEQTEPQTEVQTMSCAECKHRPIGAEICEEACHYEPQTDCAWK